MLRMAQQEPKAGLEAAGWVTHSFTSSGHQDPPPSLTQHQLGGWAPGGGAVWSRPQLCLLGVAVLPTRRSLPRQTLEQSRLSRRGGGHSS